MAFHEIESEKTLRMQSTFDAPELLALSFRSWPP
jgi:hypothetical protein